MNQKHRDFFAEHYALARQAGLSDVQARLAAVQASVESDWGTKAPGNNFHGIKAGKSWNGQTQRLTTHEIVNGQRVKVKDTFRVYDSPEASHLDWANVVGRRWPDALTAKTFDDAIAALRMGQPGGYATSNYSSTAKARDRQYASASDPYAGVPRGVAEQVVSSQPVPSLADAQRLSPLGLLGDRAPSAAQQSLAGLLNPISSAEAADMPQVASLTPEATMARVAGQDVTPQIANTEQEAQAAERAAGMYQPQGRVEPTLVTADKGPRTMTPGQYGMQTAMQPQPLSPVTEPRGLLSPETNYQHVAPTAPLSEHVAALQGAQHLAPELDTSTLYDRPPPVDPNYKPAAPAQPAPTTVQDSPVKQTIADPNAMPEAAGNTQFPTPPVDNSLFSPETKRAIAMGSVVGGPLGAIAGGLLSRFGGGLLDHLPAGGGAVAPADRYNAGSGIPGIEQGMYGARGATGYSNSSPGSYTVSRGPNQGYDLFNSMGVQTPYDSAGHIMGNRNTLKAWGGLLDGLFGGSGGGLLGGDHFTDKERASAATGKGLY